MMKKLHINLRVPDAQMLALIVMVHGIGEHGGCYEELAEKFVAQSAGFLTFDMRGHGRSPGIRGHASLNDIMNDIRFIINEIQKKYPNIPIVLLGHSLGGQIALNYAFDKDVAAHAVIASSPWLKLQHPPHTMVVNLAKWASLFAPWLSVKTGVKAEQLSQNDANTKSTKTDPLLHKKISVKLFYDMYTNGEKITRSKHQPKIPVLIMHGNADTLISFETSKTFAKNNLKDVEFKEWHEMRHNLLYDNDVFKYVIKWLNLWNLEQ